MERRDCQQCEGRRIFTRVEPETWGSSRNWCYTGHMVNRNYPCERCKGSGIDPEPTPGEVVRMAQFNVNGHEVNAPGFTAEKFAEFVDRAKAAQLRTHPGNNAVMVQSNSDDARYAVRRDRCDCQGHTFAGRCWHRAYAIWLHDVAGVDVMAVPTIGVSKRGVPLTYGRKPAMKGAA